MKRLFLLALSVSSFSLAMDFNKILEDEISNGFPASSKFTNFIGNLKENVADIPGAIDPFEVDPNPSSWLGSIVIGGATYVAKSVAMSLFQKGMKEGAAAAKAKFWDATPEVKQTAAPVQPEPCINTAESGMDFINSLDGWQLALLAEQEEEKNSTSTFFRDKYAEWRRSNYSNPYEEQTA